MAVSVVLRLVEQALRAGRLAGEVELVETGERAVVRDADDLVRFLSGNAAARSEHSSRGDEVERGPRGVER